MISIQPGLYVRIDQLDDPHAPQPRPLESGFSRDHAYLVLGMFTAAETSEAHVVLVNDGDEIWFIPNRHVRACGLEPGGCDFRLPLAEDGLVVARTPGTGSETSGGAGHTTPFRTLVTGP